MAAQLVKDWQRVKLPRMIFVKQKFQCEAIKSIDSEIRKQFYDLKLTDKLKPVKNIADRLQIL